MRLPLLLALSFIASVGQADELPTRLTNLSVRSFSGSDARVLILGYSLEGAGKPLLVRAVGPSLAPHGVANYMPDPRLRLFAGQTEMPGNNDWAGDDGHDLYAFALSPGSKDAVVRQPFTGGVYTAQAEANAGPNGEVLVEVYDGEPGTTRTRLVNVSSRAQLDDGQTLIVGMTLTGNAQKALTFRAVGPGLRAFGLTTAHPDPRIELYDQNRTLVASNDNWSGDDGASSGAFALAPGSSDAALVRALGAGGYTLHVKGAPGASGVVLVEAYESQPPTAVADLSATAGNGEVSLGWTAAKSAVSYNVKSATSSGGPYTHLGSSATNRFTHAGATNGTTYYYVVTAVNSVGEATASAEASAKPDASIAPPLVYAEENTGAHFPAPPLPAVGESAAIPPLPDPFAWGYDRTNLNGTRTTRFSDWEHHRNEARAYIEHYDIGTKPKVEPSQVTASYADGRLTVVVSANGKTLTLTSNVTLPAGATAPYPVCIGMNSAYGSLGSSPFTSRGIASVVFAHNQVTTYNGHSANDAYYQLYPEQWGKAGQYSAWSWGVSRIIDGLAHVKAKGELDVDLAHIAVTGCSYAGKMALFSGALDERIALTIAQESGGGGIPSWRYSATEPVGSVEGIAQTNRGWFSPSLFPYGGGNEKFLPYDHHMLMAMCAPRALFVTGNTGYTWLSNPSAYVSGQAVAKIYETLGIADRFGFVIAGGYTHCLLPTEQVTDLGYFLDKFIKGQAIPGQLIRRAPSSYSTIDHARWTAWWGTSNPVFP